MFSKFSQQILILDSAQDVRVVLRSIPLENVRNLDYGVRIRLRFYTHNFFLDHVEQVLEVDSAIFSEFDLFTEAVDNSVGFESEKFFILGGPHQQI